MPQNENCFPSLIIYTTDHNKLFLIYYHIAIQSYKLY